jgi:hypothetical protein
MSQSRYSSFNEDGVKSDIIPFIKIPKKSTDYYEYYVRGQTRLDNLSYKYYKDANYGWLILQANPEVGSLEFAIPNNSLLRIPYPLDSTIIAYNTEAKNKRKTV